MARAMRMYYEATTTLSGMWYGNPVLTCVLLGLPLGFLSLICYSIWCADIMDASEDEPREPFFFFLFYLETFVVQHFSVFLARQGGKETNPSLSLFLYSTDVREKED